LPTVAELAQQELSRRYSLQGRTQVAPRVQTMQNARPTVRSALSNLMRDAVDATGLEGGYRQGLLNAAGGVETAVDFLPVVGDVLGVEDASRAYGQGDMVGAGINMMGVVPVVGDVAAKGAKSALRGINAYHGSPYEFEQFSMDKIGTGRGLQAYGHGIYFSESSDIARPYSERIDDQGYMYNANLNVGAEDLLDLDAPLSQQPKKVQDMWQKFAKSRQGKASAKENGIEDIRNLVPSYGNEITGEDIRSAIYDGQPVNFNHDFSSNIAPQENKMTSEYLQKQGIKGIRYLNGKYRGAGDGPINYVIFDDSLIDTKRVNDQLTPSWMNPEARMQRANEQQFLPETVYHGTAGDIRSFDPKTYGGSVTRANSARMGTWFSDNPEVSASYARFAAEDVPIKKLIEEAEQAERKMDFEGYEKAINAAEELESSGDLINAGGQNIIPARVRGKLFEIDVEGATMSDLDDSQLYKWAQEAKEKGFDGLKIKNFSDNADYGTYTPATHYLIFDPKNIRSTNAEFDPTKADSADLLSSVGATSALRGIV
jgi:hypothetical protein